MSNTIANLQADAQANWIAINQPDIWQQTHKFLLLSGYLNHKLCGEFVDSVGNQVGYLPFDYKTLDWAPTWSWQWQGIAMTPEMLPTLHPPTATLGHITAEAAEATGIPAGLPLIAAAGDKACEVLGSGGIEPHVGCIGYGTATTINMVHEKYIEPYAFIPPYPAAMPNAYCLETQIFRGFWLISWFREEFGLLEQQRAIELDTVPEILFDELLQQTPPGADGLLLQPTWSPGVKVPGPEARGAIIGFRDVHTRAHLYRAMIEGLAYELRTYGDHMSKRSKVPITELRVAGGGSQSDAIMQITADIFGLPAARPHLHETSSLGAAIDGAVGLGLHPDFATAVGEMTRVGDVFEPDTQTHEMYDDVYERVYKKAYAQMKPLYEAMMR